MLKLYEITRWDQEDILSTRPKPSHLTTILPTGIDKSELEDITNLTDNYRVWINSRTGVIYDGNVYAEHLKMLETLRKLHLAEEEIKRLRAAILHIADWSNEGDNLSIQQFAQKILKKSFKE